MQNAWLDEAQAEIRIVGRNINNVGHADDITLKAESEEELKSLLMKVKEGSEKAGLKLNIQKMKIMASGSIISVQFSCSVVSDSLKPHESQRVRPPCLSPTPGVHSDSRPSSQWWHPAISSSIIPFSSCPQSLPASLLYGPILISIRDYWKNHSFIGKVISLLFNPLSRFVTAFFPRSKCLLISWLQSPSTVILDPKKIKSITVSIVSPPICHEVMEPCMDERVGLWRRLSTEELMLLNCGVGEDSWESLGLQGDPTSPCWRRSALGFLWKEWC